MRIGILALQGDFSAHQEFLAGLGAETCLVKTPKEMDGIDGIVLPGGESTTIWKMLERSGLTGPIRDYARAGGTTLATCAGAILLAKEIEGSDQPTLGVADLTVKRNAYGRQRESFEASLRISSLGDEPFVGVFIRAPRFVHLGVGVSSLCDHEGTSVLARTGSMILSAFHPELSKDDRVHRLFLETCRETEGARDMYTVHVP